MTRESKYCFLKFLFSNFLRTDMWKEGEYILFECSVVETGKPCLIGGWAKIVNAEEQINKEVKKQLPF